MPAAQAVEVTQAVLRVVPYYARFSGDQRRGLDHLTLALQAMQVGQRDHAKIVSRARSDPGGAASSAGASEADLESEVGSNAPSEATTRAAGRGAKRSRRRRAAAAATRWRTASGRTARTWTRSPS